jgi:hypothetical protein
LFTFCINLRKNIYSQVLSLFCLYSFNNFKKKIVWFSTPDDATISPHYTPLEGLFSEIGPYNIHSNGTISKNIYSWNKKASLLFIEYPSGVGFSYSKNKYYRMNDNKV